MPIYEYERPDGSTFEVMQGFDDETLREDPESGVPVRRVLHPPAVHFKGKGFYSTDYGTRKRQREQAAQSSSSADSASQNGKQQADGGAGGTSSDGKAAASDAKPAKSEQGSAKPSKPETVSAG